jgi:hypothetical protein
MSFQFAVGQLDGLVAVACNAGKAFQSDTASINSSCQPNG